MEIPAIRPEQVSQSVPKASDRLAIREYGCDQARRPHTSSDLYHPTSGIALRTNKVEQVATKHHMQPNVRNE